MFHDKKPHGRQPRRFSAKTRVPVAPPHLVRRPRLIAPLRRALNRRLVLVLAPAGFGKTTLVAELARELGHDAAWVALDASDTDISVFASYLLQAVAQVRPGFGANTTAWLKDTPNPAAQIDDLAANIVSEIEEAAGERLVIFLDDFHEVVNSESIASLLDLILRYLPPNVHFVLSTRLPPELTMSRLLLQQQVLGLGMDDLRFSLDETAQLLADQGEKPDREDAEQLFSATEGWVAGMVLRLAADSANPALGNATVGIAEYLAEVLAGEPLEVQNFLLRSAILSNLDVLLCQAVLDVPNAADLLQKIHERQLFMSAAGSGRARQYRLHQLFREFLADRLRERDPAEFSRLHHAAASYFEAQAEAGQAMPHLLAIEDWEAVAGLVLRGGYSEIQAGRLERVEGWLAAIPDGQKANHPAVLLIESRLLAAQSEITRATDTLAEAARRLMAAGDETSYAEALVLSARLAISRGEGATVIALALQSLAMDAAEPATRAHAAHIAGIGYAMIGDAENADTYFLRALSGFEHLGDTASTLSVSGDWGYALLIRDDLQKAVLRLEQALKLARKENNVRQQTLVLTNMGLVHQMRADLDTAERYLSLAQDLAHKAHWRRAEAEILLNKANNAIAGEKVHEALRLYGESAVVALGTSPIVRVAALAGQARCLRYAGRYGEARRIARQGIEEAPPGAMAFETALCKLELAGALLPESPDVALALLREADNTLRELGRKREAARSGALLAASLLGALELAAAESTLAAAWTVAVETGTWPQMLPELASVHGLALLRQVVKKDSRYAQLLTRLIEYLQEEKPEPLVGERSDLEVVRSRPPLLEVYSLGQAAVYRDGLPVARADWQSVTAKELFFYLVERPAGERREAIQAALWPESSPTKARNNFNISLHRLRGALGNDILRVDDITYRLNPEFALWHDGTVANALIARARRIGDRVTARRDWAAAADLLAGPYAEEFSRDWAGAQRQTWEEQTKQALIWLASDAIAGGRFSEAIAPARRLLQVDPLEETGHLLLMRVYAALRQPNMLQQQYAELTRRMQYEWGAPPSDEATALYHQLRRDLEAHDRPV